MIRYVKRFTGTKKVAKYEVILQQQNENGVWVDVDSKNPLWETFEDGRKYRVAFDLNTNININHDKQFYETL